MAWTTPRTYVAGELMTASILNTHVRDNLNMLAVRDLIIPLGELTTGVKGYFPIRNSFTIIGWTLVGNTSGSIVIDVWKDTYANFPPTVADTIAGSEKPTLSSQAKNQDLSLSSWTTGVAAGDVLGFNIDSASGLSFVTLTLHLTQA